MRRVHGKRDLTNMPTPHPQASQEYGWYADEAKRDRKYVNPKKTCAETQYATAYVKAMGKSPYASK